MLEQKGFSLDPLKAESQTTLKKLARKGHEWLARWQKRHGSCTQTFQNGSRTHAGAAVGEVRRNSFILKQGSWFFWFPVAFFLVEKSDSRRTFFWTRLAVSFPVPLRQNSKGGLTKCRAAKLDPVCEFGNLLFFILRPSVSFVVWSSWPCLGGVSGALGTSLGVGCFGCV